MTKVRTTNSNSKAKSRRATTPEARIDQLISLAVDLAEQQLRDGTASSQIVTHYLKLASTKEKDKIDIEILEEQKKLLAAKTKSIESAERSEELYSKAIAAMQRYSGNGSQEEDEYDEERYY